MASISLPRASVQGVALPVALERSRLIRLVRRDPRWLVPIVLVVYVLATTLTWNFPNWQGIPFPPLWIGVAAVTALAWRRLGRELGPVAVAAIVAVTAMLLTDITVFWSQPVRDLELYVKAGDAWAAGAPVYSQVPLVEKPDDLSNYPFLYPPLTLPLFAALAALPFPVAAAVWLGGSLAAVVAGLRIVGFGWHWILLFLAWPPVMQGLYVGNVAAPLFVLFAAAVARPALLAIPPIFKLYSGIAALWLMRREHWPDLVLGIVLVAGAAAVTVPLTGLELWARWIEGLQTYQVSQRLLPDYLYGFGLARYVPLVGVGALAVVATVLAFRARDRTEQLGRLGVATVVGSPSLFAHGWLVTLPAMARLHTPWFWLAFGLTACSPGLAWFLALGIVIASWLRPAMRKRAAPDAWHPLGAATAPWPPVEEEARREVVAAPSS